MPDAPNCQNPAWTPIEDMFVGMAWSVKEAVEDYFDNFPRRYRTRKAIECEWLRLHPKNTPGKTFAWQTEHRKALDELESMA